MELKWREVRCPQCAKLLCRCAPGALPRLEIKCPRCRGVQRFGRAADN